MSGSGDPDIVAGEFVLGTLDAGERAAFAGRLLSEATAREAVAAWERRLAPLLESTAAVHPPAAVWTAVEAALGAPAPRSAGPARPPAPRMPSVIRSRNRWRAAALAASGIAAVLIAYVGVGLRQRFVTGGETYVAAVNRGGDKPALIVTVDLASGKVQIRPVAAQAPSGHSLQLWYIGGGQPPRSLGLVAGDAITTAVPSGASAAEGGVIAVSLEPPGGSKTGGPTGAVLYSGQLVKE